MYALISLLLVVHAALSCEIQMHKEVVNGNQIGSWMGLGYIITPEQCCNYCASDPQCVLWHLNQKYSTDFCFKYSSGSLSYIGFTDDEYTAGFNG